MNYSFTIEEKSNDLEKEVQKMFLEKVKYRNKISYMIISITFGISGLSELAIQYFFKDEIKLGPADLSQVTSIFMIPWFVKPLFGLLTDFLPICGYRRKWYIIICGILDFLSFLFISMIGKTLIPFVCLLFIHSTCLSFQSVLGEAIVVELSKLSAEEENTLGNIRNTGQVEIDNKVRSNAKDNVSYFFICKYIGSLFSSIFKGILVKYFSLSQIFIICSFVPMMFVVSGMILVEYNVNEIKQIKEDETTLLKTSVGGLELLNSKKKEESCPKKFFAFLFQRHIIVPIIFTIIFVGTPSYSDALFFFFTEYLKFEPVDLGIVSLFSTISTLLAIFMYRCYFKDKTFRSMIFYGSIAGFIISFSSYLLVIRFNIKLGIPDFIFIIFSSSLIVMLGELIAMPLLSLAAVLSPKNLEGTSYSVFMSALNFGSVISNLSGSLLTTWLGITKTNFDNLPELILISNFLGLVPLPFLFCLNQNYFDPQNKEIKTSDHAAKVLEPVMNDSNENSENK